MPEKNLKKRTFDYAVSVGNLVNLLPVNSLNRHYFGQLIRSSASVGANYRASQRAKSGKDFVNKLKIVEEEADESIYFLQLLLVFNPSYKNIIMSLINEGVELLRIVVTSINNTRNRPKNEKESQ